MNKDGNNNSNSRLILFLIFFIPALIFVRGIYDIHTKKTGIMPLTPAAKADVPGDVGFEIGGDECEAEAGGGGGGSEGCP